MRGDRGRLMGNKGLSGDGRPQAPRARAEAGEAGVGAGERYEKGPMVGAR